MLDAVDAGLDRLLDGCQRRGRARSPAGRGGATRRQRRAAPRKVNWHAATSVPGVMLPPLAMIFTTSTRRSARSRTAARNASTPATSPPIIQQCPPTDVIGGPDATMCGSPARGASRRSTTDQCGSPRSRTVVTPDASWSWSAVVDDLLEVSRRELGKPLERAVARVAAQVDVRVDQAGEHRARRSRRPRTRREE